MVELVVYALMAIFIFFRLYSSLGRSSDLTLRPVNTVNDGVSEVIVNDFDNCDKGYSFLADMDHEKASRIKSVIKNIADRDKDFSLSNFIKASSIVFEYVMTALNKGNKLVLKNLLDDKLYNVFIAELDRRARMFEVSETVLVRIKVQEVIDAKINSDGLAFIAVRFITDQMNFVKDNAGELISGSLSQINVIEDLWLFKKNIYSSDHRWYLTSTDYSSC